MDELAADVTYDDVVADIYFTTYLHPVSLSPTLRRIEAAVTAVEADVTTLQGDSYRNNGLVYNDILYYAAGVSADTTIFTVPAGYVYQVTLVTMFVNDAAVWQLERSTDNIAIIRCAVANTILTRKNIWLKAGETLRLNEYGDGFTCYYTCHIIKWELV